MPWRGGCRTLQSLVSFSLFIPPAENAAHFLLCDGALGERGRPLGSGRSRAGRFFLRSGATFLLSVGCKFRACAKRCEEGVGLSENKLCMKFAASDRSTLWNNRVQRANQDLVL
eukprot:scaffold935_cov248-Pinguiococcus_pyrenoidosus.AAC.11